MIDVWSTLVDDPSSKYFFLHKNEVECVSVLMSGPLIDLDFNRLDQEQIRLKELP